MLSVYEIDQSEEWDRIVKTFKDYDSYWLSGYVKAFQIHGDGIPQLLYYENSGVRGINVVMKRDVSSDRHFTGKIPENTWFDLSTPYGYGGWIIEGTEYASLFEEYERYCKKNSIVSEFVRFHPVVKNYELPDGYYDITPLGDTVAMDLASPEIIWNNITSKNRNMIRKAQKNGIKIYNGRYPELFESFRGIYNATMDKDNAEKYYYFGPEFYQSVCEDLAQNAQIFYAVYESKIIAASIMLAANGRMNYHLSGSVREYANLAPTNLILYQAALWGCENGCKTLYLGGGVGSGEDSLFKFKKAFYRLDDLPKFCIGRKIFNQETYDMLVGMRNDLPESGFFPKYRA